MGGKNLLPMKELKALLEGNGFQDVQTYIQSGNIVLLSDNKPQQKLATLIESEFGFVPAALVLSETEFLQATMRNPYAEYQGKTVHLYFCENTAKLNHEKIDKLIAVSEEFEVHENVFYLHAPDGIGRSRLVASIEACVGTTATGRNLNTINKLSSML